MYILDELNVIPKDNKLYDTAFTHTSYANENKCESYERLEFLGDAVLELIISNYLYKNDPEAEGELTKKRAHYVCEDALYMYSLKLKLNQYIKLGIGEEENGGRTRKAIVADIFESFIGALYLDQGLEVATKFISIYIIPIIEKNELSFFNDYKSLLQEYVQTDKRDLKYILVDEYGPDHNKSFKMEVRIDDIIYGVGIAGSKKEAEQLAAKDALSKCAFKE